MAVRRPFLILRLVEFQNYRYTVILKSCHKPPHLFLFYGLTQPAV